MRVVAGLLTPMLAMAACSFDASGPSVSPDGGDVADGTPGSDNVRRVLTFDNDPREALADFPILVTLNDTRIDYSRVADPAVNLRFYDRQTQSELPYEIESWNPNGTSHVWVKVPGIVADSTTDSIEMSYGPDVQSAGPDPAGVWSNGYVTVWHMAAAPGAPNDLPNAVSMSYDGTSDGTLDAEGMVGRGRRFQNNQQSEIDFAGSSGLLNGWTAATIEFWIYPDYTSSNDFNGEEPALFRKNGTIDGGRLLEVSNNIVFQADITFAGTGTEYPQIQLQPRVWTYIALTYDGGDLQRLRDGLSQGGPWSVGSALAASTGPFVVGHYNDAFDGTIDEFRLSNVERSRGWINAQNASMRDQMISYGPPQLF